MQITLVDDVCVLIVLKFYVGKVHESSSYCPLVRKGITIKSGFLIQPLFPNSPRPMLLACDHDAAPVDLCTLKHMSGSATAVTLFTY